MFTNSSHKNIPHNALRVKPKAHTHTHTHTHTNKQTECRECSAQYKLSKHSQISSDVPTPTLVHTHECACLQIKTKWEGSYTHTHEHTTVVMQRQQQCGSKMPLQQHLKAWSITIKTVSGHPHRCSPVEHYLCTKRVYVHVALSQTVASV